MKHMTLISILVTMSMSLYVVESAIPLPILPPGAKYGLSNAITLITLELLGIRAAFLVLTLKITLTSIFFGGIALFIYSFTAGFCSFIVMIILHKKFSIITVSAAGGYIHNVTQIFVAITLMNSTSLLQYLPILCTVGLITGALNGWISEKIIKRLRIKITNSN